MDIDTIEAVAELRNKCRILGHSLHQKHHNADLWVAATYARSPCSEGEHSLSRRTENTQDVPIPTRTVIQPVNLAIGSSSESKPKKRKQRKAHANQSTRS